MRRCPVTSGNRFERKTFSNVSRDDRCNRGGSYGVASVSSSQFYSDYFRLSAGIRSKLINMRHRLLAPSVTRRQAAVLVLAPASPLMEATNVANRSTADLSNAKKAVFQGAKTGHQVLFKWNGPTSPTYTGDP